MSLTEQEIFKLCAKEPLFTIGLQQSLIKTGLPSGGATDSMRVKGSGPNGEVETRDVHRYCVRLMMKVWSGLGKFLNHQILQNRCINTVHMGKFLPSSPGVSFIPSTQFLDAAKVIFKEDAEVNLNPFTEVVGIHSSLQKQKTVQVSHASLAAVCNAPKEAINAILKEIFHKIADRARHHQELKIDLRVGYIHISNGEMEFQNIGGDGLVRSSTHDSRRVKHAFSPRGICAIYPTTQIGEAITRLLKA